MSRRNDDLKRYAQLGARAKKIAEAREELREKLVRMGSHVTDDFACHVEHQERRQLPSLATLERDHGDIVTTMKRRRLITTVEVTIVKVEARRASKKRAA